MINSIRQINYANKIWFFSKIESSRKKENSKLGRWNILISYEKRDENKFHLRLESSNTTLIEKVCKSWSLKSYSNSGLVCEIIPIHALFSQKIRVNFNFEYYFGELHLSRTFQMSKNVSSFSIAPIDFKIKNADSKWSKN